MQVNKQKVNTLENDPQKIKETLEAVVPFKAFVFDKNWRVRKQLLIYGLQNFEKINKGVTAMIHLHSRVVTLIKVVQCYESELQKTN